MVEKAEPPDRPFPAGIRARARVRARCPMSIRPLLRPFLMPLARPVVNWLYTSKDKKVDNQSSP